MPAPSPLVLLLLAPAPAGTEPSQSDAPARFSVALDSVFSLHYGDFGTSSTFRFGVRPRPHIELSATIGLAYQQWSQQRGPKLALTRPSNVMLGGRWIVDDPGRAHHGYVGLSLVLPTDIGGVDEQFEALLARDARRMRGGWDAWLWLPSTNAAVIPLGWRYNGARGFVGLDGAVAGLAHVRGPLGVGAQLRVYGGGYVGRSVIGAYGTGAFETMEGTAAAGGGAFVHTPLCRVGREACGVQLTGTAGVGVDEDGGTALSTGLGLRWGTGALEAQ